MILPYLPDEDRTAITDPDYPGVVAIWRPMDLLDKARWADECRRGKIDYNSIESRYIVLRNQLLRMEGLELKTAEGVVIPFDVSKHLRYLPLALLRPIWEDIELRSALSELDAKNSERPSGSEDLPGTAISSAEPAPKNNETTSAVS